MLNLGILVLTFSKEVNWQKDHSIFHICNWHVEQIGENCVFRVSRCVEIFRRLISWVSKLIWKVITGFAFGILSSKITKPKTGPIFTRICDWKKANGIYIYTHTIIYIHAYTYICIYIIHAHTQFINAFSSLGKSISSVVVEVIHHIQQSRGSCKYSLQCLLGRTKGEDHNLEQ